MKNFPKLTGIIALLAVIGFAVISCDTGNENGGSKYSDDENQTFTITTNDATTNDVASLGLAGTSASSSAPNAATVQITNGKIAITSVAAGTAVITIKDDSNHTATISVTVSETGTITNR